MCVCVHAVFGSFRIVIRTRGYKMGMQMALIRQGRMESSARYRRGVVFICTCRAPYVLSFGGGKGGHAKKSRATRTSNCVAGCWLVHGGGQRPEARGIWDSGPSINREVRKDLYWRTRGREFTGITSVAPSVDKAPKKSRKQGRYPWLAGRRSDANTRRHLLAVIDTRMDELLLAAPE